MYRKILFPVDLNEESSWTKALPTALEAWSYPPLADAARVADEIRHRLAARRRTDGPIPD